MREPNLQTLRVTAATGDQPQQKWISRNELLNLPALVAQEGPAVYGVRNTELAILRTNGKDHVVDCGSKHKAVQLSKILLGRQTAPILHGTYSSAGQYLRSIRTLLEHAVRRGDANVYFIGTDDKIFDELWRRSSGASRSRLADAEVNGRFESTPLMMEVLPAEAEPAALAERLMGDSVEMRLVRQLILKAKSVDEPVLIVGEAGTGKDTVAHAIHEFRGGPFMQVNCGATGANEFDAEVFGVAKSAGTSTRARQGLWQLAEHGVLYLDEINSLAMPSQARVSETLDSERIRPVGAHDGAKYHVRIMASTSRDLLTLVRDGRFHEDLYYRLRRFMIHLPALREHTGDIPKIANALWRKITGDARAGLPESVLAGLLSRTWPGNIRELKSVLCQIHGLFGSVKLKVEHLNAVLQYEGRGLAPRVTDTQGVDPMDSLQHLRKADEIVQSTRMVLTQAMARARTSGGDTSSVQELINRRVTELDLLCTKPLLFRGATYTAIYKLKGMLYYFWKLMQSDRKTATRFWKTDLSRQFRNVTAELSKESGALVRC